MHNNEFEKRVEQKLEELKFTPSDAVWQKVEAQIKQPERRRRFIFWWLSAAVLFLGFMGWITFFKNTNPELANVKNSTRNKSQSISKSNDDFNPTKPIEENYPAVKENNEQLTNQIKLPVSVVSITKYSTLKIKNPELVFVEEISTQQKNDSTNKSKNSSIKNENNKVDYLTDELTIESSVNKNNDLNTSVEVSDSAKNKEPISVEKTEHHLAVESKMAADDSIQSIIHKLNLAKTKKSISNKNKIEIALNFKAGIAGISSFSKSFKFVDMLSTSPNISGQNFPSKSGQGAGFGAGIQMKKWLKKRIAFSTGLEYSFYSSSIKTGSNVDSVARFTSNAGDIVVNSSFKNGTANTFINRYHFIEIPLMLQWQINKIKNRPVYLNGGIVYSYLASSNAIYFDSGADNYYYSKSLFNRSQFQLRTGIAMGMIKKLNYPLTIGLQYQYNLSGQWQKSLDLNQHLSFTGIQLSWRLNKN